MTLTERHPSIRILALSIVIGLATAMFLSAIVALCMWQSGAAWEMALDTGWRLGTLLALACPSGIAMATLIRYLAGVLPQNIEVRAQDEVVEVNVGEWQPTPSDWNGAVLDTLPAQEICNAATLIATLQYRDGVNPTRDLVCQEYGISQPVWNSARRVLQEMGLVQDRQWVELSWEDVQSRLDRLRVDGDTIWCPHKRGMHVLHVSNKYDAHTKSYVTTPP